MSQRDRSRRPPHLPKSPLGWEILDYLVRHPEATDTLEGIARWWLLEQRVRFLLRGVEAALAELVRCRMLLERRGVDGRVHYRLNPETRSVVEQQLSRKPARGLGATRRAARRIEEQS